MHETDEPRAGAPAGDAGSRRGLLVPIGGNEDRTGDRKVLRSILSCLQQQLGEDREVAVLTAASGEPRHVWEQYQQAFQGLGVRPVWLDMRTPAAAAEEALLTVLERVPLLFMSGGDQQRLMEMLDGSPARDVMERRHRDGSLSIAGTSAGASALGAFMPNGTEGDQIFSAPREALSRGLGLLPRLLVDQHFAERRRHARLVSLLTRETTPVGIGIDEDTAVLVQPGRSMRVVGAGSVTVALRDHHGTQVVRHAPTGAAPVELVAMEGVSFGLLPAGTFLEVERLPDELPAVLKRVVQEIVAEA